MNNRYLKKQNSTSEWIPTDFDMKSFVQSQDEQSEKLALSNVREAISEIVSLNVMYLNKGAMPGYKMLTEKLDKIFYYLDQVEEWFYEK